jgi:uncharacterized protein YxjI
MTIEQQGSYNYTGLNPFQHTNYLVRKQMLKLFGGAFRIYDPMGNLALFVEMKAFKLKEDLRIYTGEDKLHEVLTIKARGILDFSMTYDVVDPTTGEAVGALRRKGMKSILKDEWEILEPTGVQTGTIQEDSWLMAILRRFLSNLIPQHYHGEMNGRPVLEFHQNFNPFTFKLTVDFSSDLMGALDRRLGLAAAVLICAIEGREQS